MCALHVCSVNRTQNVQFAKQTLWLMSVGVYVSWLCICLAGWMLVAHAKHFSNAFASAYMPFTVCVYVYTVQMKADKFMLGNHPALSTQLFFQSFQVSVLIYLTVSTSNNRISFYNPKKQILVHTVIHYTISE